MLEKIRSKPDHVKKSLALVLTIFFFTIIVSIWLSSWDARATSEVSKEKAKSPLSGLKTVLSGITDEIRATYTSAPVLSGEEVATSTLDTATQGASVIDASRIVVIDQAKTISTTTSTSTTR